MPAPRSNAAPPPGSSPDHVPSCRRHADCAASTFCVRNVCVGKERLPSPPKRPDDIASDAPFGYVGGVLGASLPNDWQGAVGEGLQSSIRLGVVLERHLQLQLEVSPATTVVFKGDGPPIGACDFVGSVGALVPMSSQAAWIFRIGGGGGTSFGETSPPGARPVQPFGEVRFDIVGVVIRTSRHLLVEFNAPSFRIIDTRTASGKSAISLMPVSSVGIFYAF